MEYLISYGSFCLTTAIMGSMYLLHPVLGGLKNKQPLNPVVQYTVITHIVFFSMSFLLAPMMFLSVIIPSFGDRFKLTLTQSLES